jgi:hypothetical protein
MLRPNVDAPSAQHNSTAVYQLFADAIRNGQDTEVYSLLARYPEACMVTTPLSKRKKAVALVQLAAMVDNLELYRALAARVCTDPSCRSLSHTKCKRSTTYATIANLATSIEKADVSEVQKLAGLVSILHDILWQYRNEIPTLCADVWTSVERYQPRVRRMLCWFGYYCIQRDMVGQDNSIKLFAFNMRDLSQAKSDQNVREADQKIYTLAVEEGLQVLPADLARIVVGYAVPSFCDTLVILSRCQPQFLHPT